MKKVIEIKKKNVISLPAVAVSVSVLVSQIPTIDQLNSSSSSTFNFRQKAKSFIKTEVDYLSDNDIDELELEIYQKIMSERLDLNEKLLIEVYNNELQHLCVNLNPNAYVKNNYLKEQITTGKLKIKELPYLSNRELFPDKWSAYNKREEIELNVHIKGEAYVATDMYTCNRCKQNKCKYFQMQTRSADEGMTNFTTCMNCNNHWKQNN